MSQNKSETYRKMLAYLEDLGADVGSHAEAGISRMASSFVEMDPINLIHYQRVLEATIDNRDDSLMDKESMKEELTEVVRERFARGSVEDKTTEAKEFRARLASL